MQGNYNNSVEYYEEKPDRGSNPDLKGVLLKYFRFWPYVLVSVALALAAALMKNKFTHPIYQQQSSFLIKEDDRNTGILDLTGMSNGVGFGNSGQVLSNASIIFKSKPLAEKALGYLDFDVEYYVDGTFIKTEIYKERPIEVVLDWDSPQLIEGYIKVSWKNDHEYNVELLDDEYFLIVPGDDFERPIENPELTKDKLLFGEWTDLQLVKFKIDLVSNEKEGEIFLKLRDKKSLISQYTDDEFQVWPLDAASSILGLSIINQQPDKGQLYLNTLMGVYLDNELEEKTRMASNTVDFIDSQISGVSDSLDYTSTDLQNYRASNKTYNIGSEGTTIFTQLSELERNLSQEKYKRNYYRKLQEYLVREEYGEILVPSGLGIDDPILNSLIENLIALQAERSRYMATQTQASPTVVEVGRKIRDLNASIKEILINVTENVDFVISDLEARIDGIETEFSRLPTTEQNLLRFQRKFDLNENIYTFLLQRRAESAIAMASNTASNKIVEYAGLSYKPLTIKPLTNYLIALLLGFMLPIGAIALIVLFDDKITDKKQLEENLNVPLLAQIGQKTIKSNLVALNVPRSSIAEAFRSLRTNITFIIPKEKQLTIAVTSTIAGEGKTFSSINLASAYSLNGKRTILMACDLHKPKVLGDFNLKGSAGLSTYLSEQNDDVSSIIQHSSFSNLDIIVAGPIPPNPSELIANKRFERILHELKEKYEVIILDTPPVGIASETLAIMKLVDLSLYVLRYNYSKYSFTEEINFLKHGKGLRNIYAIYNDIPQKKLNYGGYGYGYYKEDKKGSDLTENFLKGSHSDENV